MTIEITQPELEGLMVQRLSDGTFQDAEQVILEALRSSAAQAEVDRKYAIARLKTFAQRHDLSLNLTLHELREEARP